MIFLQFDLLNFDNKIIIPKSFDIILDKGTIDALYPENN